MLLREAVVTPLILRRDRGTRCEFRAEAEEAEEAEGGERSRLIGLAVAAPERNGVEVLLVEERGAAPPGRSVEEQEEAGWLEAAAKGGGE